MEHAVLHPGDALRRSGIRELPHRSVRGQDITDTDDSAVARVKADLLRRDREGVHALHTAEDEAVRDRRIVFSRGRDRDRAGPKGPHHAVRVHRSDIGIIGRPGDETVDIPGARRDMGRQLIRAAHAQFVVPVRLKGYGGDRGIQDGELGGTGHVPVPGSSGNGDGLRRIRRDVEDLPVHGADGRGDIPHEAVIGVGGLDALDAQSLVRQDVRGEIRQSKGLHFPADVEHDAAADAVLGSGRQGGGAVFDGPERAGDRIGHLDHGGIRTGPGDQVIDVVLIRRRHRMGPVIHLEEQVRFRRADGIPPVQGLDP